MNVNRAIFILAVAVAAAGAGVIWQKEPIPGPAGSSGDSHQSGKV